MWCFKEQEGRCIYILPGHKVSFGKSLSNIKIEGDATVSRLHAIVSSEPYEEQELQYKCVIQDRSKYGTYVLRDGEKRKLFTDEKFILKAGDKVQFGLKHSIFIVLRHSFLVVASSLCKEEMEKLRSIVKDIGGVLSDNWHNSCTYLTVPNEFLFTIKLACALASSKMIVTTGYWEAIMKAIGENKELPKIEDFLPTVTKEEWIRVDTQLLPKEERRTLFRGLSFVHFCAKQYSAYAPIITAAGGKSCVYPTKKPLTPRDLTAKNAIVIQQPTNDSSQFTIQVIATDYPIIHQKLSALKRRMICDSEIPLAILHCSTEKYCNPKFNFGTILKSSTQMFSPSDLVIVEDTQDASSTSNKRKIEGTEQPRIIPETLDSQCDSGTSKKVRICDKNEQEDILENSKRESDVFSNKNDKQPQIIPETCDSLDKSIASDNFSRSDIKKPRIIPESCDKNSVSSPSIQDEQCSKDISPEDIGFPQEEKVILEKKHGSTLEKRNVMFEEDDLLLEDTTFNKDNLTLKRKNLMFKKSCPLKNDNWAGQNDEDESESWKSSKGPRIVSIEKINNSDKSNIRTDRMANKSLGKDCFEIEESFDSQLKQRDKYDDEKVEVIDIEKENKRGKEKSRKMEMKELKIEEKDEKREVERRKIGTDWYDKYLSAEFTDKILRKDAPCGKRFTKVLIPIPAKKLRADDFIL
ncbi:nibrin [Harpegnathos saltator]|uniref:nibrin n=1 Tax=Harpegnathos saltator TaxID=610380 RepID=UPI000DBEF13E|nr:nibrin [Harpegnathos saltator]XP_011138846.2 nibrin [Harpegnathos saltator]XP_011138847.2 nibrin [Harpegnathos saltator]